MSEHDREPKDAELEHRLRADLRRLVAATSPEVRKRLDDMATQIRVGLMPLLLTDVMSASMPSVRNGS